MEGGKCQKRCKRRQKNWFLFAKKRANRKCRQQQEQKQKHIQNVPTRAQPANMTLLRTKNDFNIISVGIFSATGFVACIDIDISSTFLFFIRTAEEKVISICCCCCRRCRRCSSSRRIFFNRSIEIILIIIRCKAKAILDIRKKRDILDHCPLMVYHVFIMICPVVNVIVSICVLGIYLFFVYYPRNAKKFKV